MERNKAIEIAQQLFKSYPTTDAFFITSDGQAFEIEENANAHARHLDASKPEVITVMRNEMPGKAAPAKGAKAQKDDGTETGKDGVAGEEGGEDDEPAPTPAKKEAPAMGGKKEK